jgi:hypothetical protein
MGRYLVEVAQEITAHITVHADNVEDAQKRALHGMGEFGDQESGELRIVATRRLEPASEACYGEE